MWGLRLAFTAWLLTAKNPSPGEFLLGSGCLHHGALQGALGPVCALVHSPRCWGLSMSPEGDGHGTGK